MYLMMQEPIWWIVHIVASFWSIYFPFSYRVWKKSGKINRVYVGFIAIGLIVPVFPVVAIMGGHAAEKTYLANNLTFWESGAGFNIAIFPPLTCLAADPKVTYYSLILPMNIITMFGFTLLFLILWIVIKVSCSFILFCFDNPDKAIFETHTVNNRNQQTQNSFPFHFNETSYF